ncbi:endoribonuclease Dicer [Trichonephila clavipes]|nr:endoribonuclease Dicer [Trichonephila clavipes]
MLIREMADEVRKPFVEGGKRIFFLVPTVPLVTQQAKTIKDHTDLEVNGYYGEMDVDSWSKTDWIEQFKKSEVLVMTAEIFRIIVHHSFIPLTQIQLLIFDECHRAQGDHPYREAMKCFVGVTAEQMPRIFGLSASLLNGKCKPTQLEKNLKDLEMTLKSSIITASDILDLQKYGTDPDEYIVMYSRYEIINSGLLKEVEILVQKMYLQKSNIDSNSAFMEDNLFFDKPVRCLKSLSTTLSDLGPWCAYIAADIYIKEIETMLNRPFAVEYVKILKEVLEFLKYFSDMCKCLDNNSNGTDLDVMPSKLKRLLGIFLAARRSKMFQSEPVSILKDVTFKQNPEKYCANMKKEKKQSINLYSIVFVQQRITAYVLCQWLLEIKKSFNELEFLDPEFVVGHGTMGVSQTSMSEKLQQKKLKNFREKKNNVLVATQVLEEGMDITQCNLVTRFDLPGDFRSYVQSKGRARAKNSIYVMLLEQGEKYEKFTIDLVNFKTIEKMLQSKCHGREMPTEEEITSHMADEAIPPYMPRGSNGPRISMSAAISLINRYCSTLPSDMATKLVPQWKIKIVDEDDIKKEFQCELRMPINSPLREIIVRHCYRVSAADKGCWVYPLDPRPDVVALYSGYTPETDENITKIKCPPLQLLPPLSSIPQPNTFPSIPSISTSSYTIQANILPSASSIKPTTQFESLLPEPISSAAAPDNSLNTSASSLSAENRNPTTSNKFAALSTEIQPLVPLPESVPTTSNSEHSNAPEIPQCVKRNSRNRRKRPKVQKAEIEIKMAPHRPRKSAPTELTTDDEDMITYEVQEEELEPDPAGKFPINEDPLNFPKGYLCSLTPS